MDGAQQGNGQSDSNEPTWQFRPGETISPRTTSAPEPAQPAPLEEPAPLPEPAAVPPSPTPAPPVPEATPAPPAPAPTQQTDPAPIVSADPSPQPAADWQNEADSGLSWTASEFVAHGKSASWHTLLIAGAVVLAVVVWFISKDIVSPIVIVVAGIVLSTYGGRQPKELQYQLNDYGIAIGGRQFSFGEFRAFSLMQEGGAFDSIALIPTKRFLPLTTLYYDPADEDRILDIIGAHLPHMERKADAIDVLMRRLRF